MCLDGVFLKAIRPVCLFQRQCLRADCLYVGRQGQALETSL